LPNKHKLRAERVDNCKMTQKALGAAAGVSPSTISNIECHRGPDVPRSQLHPTKTKTDTAVKLAVAVGKIRPGVYTLAEFVARQDLFSEAELYEALKNQLARERRRKRNTRHLKMAS